MKNILFAIQGVCLGILLYVCYGANNLNIIPPDFLSSTVYAASVTTVGTGSTAVSQSVGQESGFASMLISLAFISLLIYVIRILYTKLKNFYLKIMEGPIGSCNAEERISVLSRTFLGANKSLYLVELEGKRMLIGASANSMHLIKDLGSCTENGIEEGEFSKIEIPNIRIQGNEMPKMEIPGFTNVVSKVKEENECESVSDLYREESTEFSDVYKKYSAGVTDDNLFYTTPVDYRHKESSLHKVNPDEFALYKKYL